MASLVKAVDAEITKDGALKGFVVVLTDDADKTADALKGLAKEKSIQNVPLTLIESLAGPPSYKIAKDAEVTVLMWSGLSVKVNRAYGAGQLTEPDVKTLVADIAKIRGK